MRCGCARPGGRCGRRCVRERGPPAAKGHGPVGFVNPALYNIGLSSNYASSFHDITVGSNPSNKGKGVSYMENVPIWHYRSPNAEEYRQALKELEGVSA